MLGYGFHSDYYILYNPGGQIIFKGLELILTHSFNIFRENHFVKSTAVWHSPL
jgi:hypothetical protein